MAANKEINLSIHVHWKTTTPSTPTTHSR